MRNVGQSANQSSPSQGKLFQVRNSRFGPSRANVWKTAAVVRLRQPKVAIGRGCRNEMRAIELRKERSPHTKISQEVKLIHAAEKAFEPDWRDELWIGSGVI